jgi:hypothetical protein
MNFAQEQDRAALDAAIHSATSPEKTGQFCWDFSWWTEREGRWALILVGDYDTENALVVPMSDTSVFCAYGIETSMVNRTFKVPDTMRSMTSDGVNFADIDGAAADIVASMQLLSVIFSARTNEKSS